MRLYIIRHADPDYENNTITPEGHLEAKALARRMAKEKLHKIYASPMGRAQHTMQYTADALKLKSTTENWTAELESWRADQNKYGISMIWDVPGEKIRGGEKVPHHHDWHEHDPFDDAKLKQEYEKICAQSDAFFLRHGYERKGHRYRCVKPHQERIAVFCHGGFGLTWLSHLLALPLPMVWSGFWLPPSSVTTVLLDERSKEWAVPRCIGMADCSHLYEAGLPIRPRGIKTNFD